MNISIYEVKSGSYKGSFHVREYLGNGKYFHIARTKTLVQAESAAQMHQARDISNSMFGGGRAILISTT